MAAGAHGGGSMFTSWSGKKTEGKERLESFFFNFYFIHMCIQCLGHFSPLPPTTSLTPFTPHYPEDTILPLPLVWLKREYQQ
jgi:hypothetical protein